MKPIDILGDKLKTGDICAYIKKERTGSSTVREILNIGKITDISRSGTPTFDGETKVYNPCDIVKICDSISPLRKCSHCGAKMDKEDEQ